MTANRLVYVGIAIALALTAALTFTNARTSIALAQADRVYDQVERMRAERWIESGLADRSYDAIEKLRAKQYAMHRVQSASHLEELEGIRAR
jgi:hypothetical protein